MVSDLSENGEKSVKRGSKRKRKKERERGRGRQESEEERIRESENKQVYSSNRKIQDPIYPGEVRYEAITGHVAQ